MNITKVAMTIIAGGMLVGCAAKEERYVSEADKLQEYAVNTAKCIRKGIRDVNVNLDVQGVEYDMKRFKFVEPYLDSFKTDIDMDRLPQYEQMIYSDMLRGTKVYSDMLNAMENGSDRWFMNHHDSIDGESDMVSLAEAYYSEANDNNECKPLEDYRED